MRETFDIAVSRAVARLNISVSCVCLCPARRAVPAMKGPDFSQELSEAEHAISVLGAKLWIFSATPSPALTSFTVWL